MPKEKNQNKNEMPEEVKSYLENIEEQIFKIKQLLFAKEQIATRNDLFTSPDGQIIEGVFNGESMVDQDGKSHLIPANYASKSRLVVGDKLKLTVTPDGRQLYKQIGPVERKHLVATLYIGSNKYWAKAVEKKYRVLMAAVTFLKLNDGDKISIVVPKDIESNWAAIEDKI